ncbi:hypothetical protein MMPV_002254 [Pyropia vietnamensis]
MASVDRPAEKPYFAYRSHKCVVRVHIEMLFVGQPTWALALGLGGSCSEYTAWVFVVLIARAILQMVLNRAGQTLLAVASPDRVLPVPRASLLRCYLIYASLAVVYGFLTTGASSVAWLHVVGVLGRSLTKYQVLEIVSGLTSGAAAVVSWVDAYLEKELVPADGSTA